MVIEKDIISLKDVAELCCTTSSNVSNWRKRDSKFPEPFAETAAGPVWKAEDIVAYLQNKFGKDKYDAIASGNILSKRVAVIGRARSGKSFFISRFVYDRNGFINLFCGNSKDKTVCPIYVKISEYITSESFEFHSNFNSIYSGEEKDNAELRKLNERVTKLLGNRYFQDDVAAMKEIEDTIVEMRKFAKGDSRVNTYIDVHQRPSDFCKSLLRVCKLGIIEMVDTPGVSGNVEALPISKSDIYIFVLRPDNSDEATTLCNIVESIKADVATSKVAFLYKKEGIYSSKKEYDEARKEVHEDMKAYNENFKKLKGNIISTDIDLLDPAGHCIAFPTMDKVNSSFQEDFFLEDISKKMMEAFNPIDEFDRDTEFVELVSSIDEAKDFVIDIMREIPVHDLGILDVIYSTEEVISGNHNRVMTRDNYRFRSDLDWAYKKESSLLNSYFSEFKAEDYPKEWQQIVIKYIYRKISASVRTDRGLGIGTHPWEERPARTMLIEESIFADRILKNIVDKDERLIDEKSINEPYRLALHNSNISSATWEYVGCINDEDSLIKLAIVKECLLNVKVSSRKEMVLCRYVGGLRKISQYRILEKLGFEKSECMKKVASLPF